ncbi:phage integrase SAM-like domain-containing protein, partial [Escherichia coli]
MIEAYEAYLKQQDVCRNTSSFYMRILRAVYNRAVEQELIAQQYPFRRVYTGIDKTRKRAIPFETVKLIKQLDLQQSPSSDMAKD